jgi:hypothetical protein
MIQPTVIQEEKTSKKRDDEGSDISDDLDVSETSVLVVRENGQLVEDDIDSDPGPDEREINPDDPDAEQAGNPPRENE